MRHHEIFRSKQVLQVVTSQLRAIQLRICSVLRSFPNPDADADGATDATDAADAATLGAAAGRAEAASGAVACAGSAAMAWTGASAACSGETRAHGASGDANREGRGQARGEAIAMDLCSAPSKHPRTSCQSQGGPPMPKATGGVHAREAPRAEGAASDWWPSAQGPRRGGDAPNWLQEILGAEPLQVLLNCSVVPVPFARKAFIPRDSLMIDYNVDLHHGRYSMALFLHVLSPQNDVALVLL